MRSPQEIPGVTLSNWFSGNLVLWYSLNVSPVSNLVIPC